MYHPDKICCISNVPCNTFCSIIIVAEDIVIRRTEPGPNSQEFPCPHQRIQYECTTLRPVAAQFWDLIPSSVRLSFTGASAVGRVRNSSDDQFSATLTSKMEDEDPESDDLFFTSTLLIIDPVNGSELTCSGTAASGTVFQESTTVVLSGECIMDGMGRISRVRCIKCFITRRETINTARASKHHRYHSRTFP